MPGRIGAVTRSIENLKAAASEAGEMRARLEAGQTSSISIPTWSILRSVLDRMRPRTTNCRSSSRRSGSPDSRCRSWCDRIRRHGQISDRVRTPAKRAARELARPVRAVVAHDDADLLSPRARKTAPARSQFHRTGIVRRQTGGGRIRSRNNHGSAHVDKTGLSRLISVAVEVPREVIKAIGPAPKIGRDRWTELAARSRLNQRWRLFRTCWRPTRSSEPGPTNASKSCC